LIISWIIITTATIATAQDYSRTEFGGWIDEDGDCRNTRHEILMRDSYFPDTVMCKVTSGMWYLPYSDTYTFNPSSIDIDHIIPLRHAWYAGAKTWTKEERVSFANDTQNLIAVSASENRSKGARSPDQWLPPNPPYWCEYVNNWVNLKKKYRLESSAQEQNMINVVTKACERMVDHY